MSGFERPAVWVGALPWAAFCVWLAWTQATARAEARRRVAPRFLTRVTRYSLGSLATHVAALLALGLGLLLMIAEPVVPRRPGPGAGAGRVLLLIDASASMYATDAEPLSKPAPESAEGEVARFDVARAAGLELVRTLDDSSFGVVSFSGTATLHLPITADRELVESSLETLEVHTYYRNTGSSLAGALETVFRFTAETAGDLQVVLLGDGELPFEESFAEPLAGLTDLGVPVHAVAIGSSEGQKRVIYDFHDVTAGKARDDRRVLREYHTRREDRHYREVAAATGGRFLLAEPRPVGELAAVMRDRTAAAAAVAEDQRRDGTGWLALAALAGCLAHLVFLTPLRPPPGSAFELERLGEAPRRSHATPRLAVWWFLAALPLLVWSCADGPRSRAHRANERGLVLDDLGRSEAARAQFELSASLGFRPEIPTHNLARSLARRSEYTEAHRLFQRALEFEPRLVDAVFNDGVTLYEWGRAERDPRDCQLERTLELWRGAHRRFASIVEGVVERDEPAARAGRNLDRLDEEIATVERLIAEPPEHCGAAGGAGSGGGGEGEGDGDGGSPPGGSAAPPSLSEPESPPASGPLTADERERIADELERIASQASGEGKFYRRTRSEQFPREAWSQPDEVIWW